MFRFKYPIPEGGVVVVEAKVSRAFSTSMEIYCDVWLDNPITKEKIHTNEGIYTFVAVDKITILLLFLSLFHNLMLKKQDLMQRFVEKNFL